MTGLVNVFTDDTRYLKVAREIAVNFYDTEEILKRHNIGPDEWERIKKDERFLRLLDAEVQAWNSSMNTHERTKAKAAALIEEFLPEANKRLHSESDTLPAKVELLKTLVKVAGMGEREIGVATGSGFNVTINLGADHKLEFSKTLPHKVIEGEILNEA